MGAAERLGTLPNWPLRMCEDYAALYLGVSKTLFREKWQRGEYPEPVREGKRLLWHRRQLDRFVDAQFGLQQLPGSSSRDDTWDDFR